MKLPLFALDLSAALAEFDIWITPTLGEIRESKRFREELDRIVSIFEFFVAATNEFRSIQSCDPAEIASTAAAAIESMDEASGSEWLASLAAVLFLVTGKSDNNAKCQLPLYLRDIARWSALPVLRRSRSGPPSVAELKMPRVLKAEKFMGLVASLRGYPEAQRKLLDLFVKFVLSDEDYITQFWAIGRSYAALKQFNRERDLLSPIVVFQVRGSVAAMGGHEPESILRDIMRDWGLQDDIDFNLADAVITKADGGLVPLEGEETEAVREKTRAYDFVLPFRTPSWTPLIFVQCQFYAGDSGSVSHKNVDQTKASRKSVLEFSASARFLEFVDGAGYFSSLNRDLQSLLSMRRPPTTSFFQVRSAPIRLRRELQAIGYLVPIELEQAVLRGSDTAKKLSVSLTADGYSPIEVDRVLTNSRGRLLTVRPGDALEIAPSRREMVRRYVVLDTIARNGRQIDTIQERLSGYLLIPGYGPFFGMKIDDMVTAALREAPGLETDWRNPELPLRDIRWLVERGYAISA